MEKDAPRGSSQWTGSGIIEDLPLSQGRVPYNACLARFQNCHEQVATLCFLHFPPLNGNVMVLPCPWCTIICQKWGGEGNLSSEFSGFRIMGSCTGPDWIGDLMPQRPSTPRTGVGGCLRVVPHGEAKSVPCGKEKGKRRQMVIRRADHGQDFKFFLRVFPCFLGSLLIYLCVPTDTTCLSSSKATMGLKRCTWLPALAGPPVVFPSATVPWEGSRTPVYGPGKTTRGQKDPPSLYDSPLCHQPAFDFTKTQLPPKVMSCGSPGEYDLGIDHKADHVINHLIHLAEWLRWQAHTTCVTLTKLLNHSVSLFPHS